MSYCGEKMSATAGNISESSEINSECTRCRLCLKRNDYYHNIFTSIVASEITVEDALYDLVHLKVAVGDGLPAAMCPQCLKNLMEFNDFRNICHESDAELRKFSSRNYVRNIEGEGAADEKSRPNVETKDCIQDVIHNTTKQAWSTQTTEVYIPVSDCLLSRDDEFFHVKEEKNDQIIEESYPVLHTPDPAGISIDVSDPLATDDLFHVKEENKDHLIEESYPVLHMPDPARISSDDSGPLTTFMENGELIQNRTVAIESMKEAVEHPAFERASASFAILEPKTRVSHSWKGWKLINKNIDKCGAILSDKIMLCSIPDDGQFHSKSRHASKIRGDRAAMTMTSKSLNQLICKRRGVRHEGNGLLKDNYGETREKKNVREVRRGLIVDGKSCKDSPQTAKKPYSCYECEKSFTEKSHHVSHIWTHRKEKPYSCNDCDKSFSRRANLACHIRTHTKEKPYSCNECDKSFSRRGNLACHIRTHTKEKLYPCNECEKSYTQKHNLVVHKHTHTGEKPYLCNQCDKSYARKYDLVVHKRMYTGQKTYSCNECDKSFSQKSRLVTHIRTHTKEKP